MPIRRAVAQDAAGFSPITIRQSTIRESAIASRQSAMTRISFQSMSLRDLRRHIGQLAIIGFDGYTLSPDVSRIAREYDLGGVIFFARNVAEPEQVAELARESAQLARELPLWVSVDQEGGRVARLKRPFTEWPPMATLGRAGDETLVERFARALAAELKAVGINLDYTPVLDVLTNAKNPVIGDRALAERAEDVARLGTIIIKTLQSEGVAACGKHFPGHGDTSVDSHFELPLIEHAPDRLEAVELVPFKAAIEAGVASIMTAHILIPALDQERPATLSPAIVDGMLKKKLGYDGLVLSDDLEMKAISGRYGQSEATVQAIAAGCDAVLMCAANPEEQVAALEAVIYAVEQERLPTSRVEDALARQRRVKERFLGRPAARHGAASLRALLGRDEHQAIAAEMARFA
jgi:beta-N-acetylhexosaminidase